jgi:hypothetical protein
MDDVEDEVTSEPLTAYRREISCHSSDQKLGQIPATRSTIFRGFYLKSLALLGMKISFMCLGMVNESCAIMKVTGVGTLGKGAKEVPVQN